MRDLTALRGQIDALDAQLLDLFLQRMSVAEEVGAYKRSHGLPVLDPQREAELLAQKTAQVPPDLRDDAAALFETLMALSRRRQRRLVPEEDPAFQRYLADKAQAAPPVPDPRVVYQGERGAYAEEAAAAFFGETCRRRNLPDWEDLFAALQAGEADYGVLPIENSSTGSIRPVYDLLAHWGAFIVGEVTLKIRHCLLAPPGVELEDVTAVYSHEQGLSQCAPFLKAHPHWTATALSNTAAAAKFVAQQGTACAAIGSERCAQLYGLHVLARHIAQAEENSTRFVVVAPHMELDPGRDKVSALFTLPHQAGSLHQILSVFAVGGLNLLKLESRPIPGRSWEYRFFADFSGSLLDPELDQVLRELTQRAASFRILGNYRSDPA